LLLLVPGPGCPAADDDLLYAACTSISLLYSPSWWLMSAKYVLRDWQQQQPHNQGEGHNTE
jgi:hypothetical protein